MMKVEEALERGMVLVVSMWDDIVVSMIWLDSYTNCDPSEPKQVLGRSRDQSVQGLAAGYR